MTEADVWEQLLQAAAGAVPLPSAHDFPAPVRPFVERYLPFLQPCRGRPVVLAHLAQSLDGRIALPDGESQWISGEADLHHTHRLRALADAVVVGARTVERDDPQLTTRHVPGPSPLRVVVDPARSLGPDYQVFQDGLAPTILVTGTDDPAPAGIDLLHLEKVDGIVQPGALLEALAARGIGRVLIEGGGVTVSRFLAAGCVDRLHVVVAPVLLGHGRPALSIPMASTLADCPRPPVRVEPLGDDWLFDCAIP